MDPKFCTFYELLSNRLFVIPDNQRPYSWEKKQRKNLLDDITKVLSSSGQKHFMSTIVCVKNQSPIQSIGSTQFERLDVIDGQQRLTTLIILFRAITLKIKNEDEQTAADKLLVKMANSNDNQPTAFLLLRNNHDEQLLLQRFLKNESLPNKDECKTWSEKNLHEAFDDCMSFIADKDEAGLLKLLTTIKNDLTFILYLLPDEATGYRAFETLNNRGLKVDNLDNCKNILMGIAFERNSDEASRNGMIATINEHWKNIYGEIGTTNLSGDEILRFALTLKHDVERSKVISADDAIEKMRVHCEQDATKISAYTEFLSLIAKELNKLNQNKKLRGVTAIAHARLLAIAIEISRYDQEQKEKLKGYWERITFRIFGLSRKDARTKVGEYTKLAWNIYNQKSTYDQAVTEMKSIGSDTEFLIDEVLNNIKNKDCYSNWKDEVRYFFYLYEETLNDTNTTVWENIWQLTAENTIEHIYPQQPSNDGQAMLDKENLHRLGNLGLLNNSQQGRASNNSFDSKKETYKDSGLKFMRELAEQYQNWGVDEINQREEKLLEWAKGVWCDEPKPRKNWDDKNAKWK